MVLKRPLSPFVTFFLGVFVLSAGIGLAALPVWLHQRAQERRGENERTAAAVMKSLASAQAEFWVRDLDGNGIQDYWTGDLAGLYRWGLIDRATAMADLRPIVPLGPRPVPRNGYFFSALHVDASVDPPESYRQVTDPASGPVHNRTRFGFVAIPAEFRVTGLPVIVINEGNAMRACREGDACLGLRHWPSDDEFRSHWSTYG
ncbi:MAG TPA: hypothetical protein VEJ18_20550 [Planctomycetota bacterium]|nr:hypothetical protein [Planctomycetota bacterium]